MMSLALTAVSWMGNVRRLLFDALECCKEIFSSDHDDLLNSTLLANLMNYFSGLSYD